MLTEILGLYLQGLLLSSLTVVGLVIAWLSYRFYMKLDKSYEERKQIVYEAIVICLICIPIAAFAFMAILLMMKA